MEEIRNGYKNLQKILRRKRSGLGEKKMIKCPIGTWDVRFRNGD
jgi:hypothetical protein